MQALANMCVRRPVTATVIILILSVVGFFGYTKLGVDRFPKVDFPIVTITTVQPGSSPEEIETEIVDKIEEAVNTIAGIDQLSSISSEGVGIVVVSFQLEKDINVASQEVRDKLNQILSELPAGIEQPIIDKVDTDAGAVIEFALSADDTIRNITEYADKVVRRRIEGVSGVGQVRILGGRKRQINISVDASRLRAVGLTILDVQRALQAQNIQIPGGTVDQGQSELTLRTYGRVGSVAEFNDILIAKRGDTVIRLRDVGSVEDGMEGAETVANLAGKPTVLISVRKQSGTNTVATAEAVKERLKELEKTLPKNYKLIITRDQSEYIIASTESVKEHLIVGSILAALVVLVFLWNWRTTIISAIAIPTSIISTFALMYAMGFTLNGLTLLALTLSVGIVIDDAIVVLENIYRFIEEKGMNPFEAAIEGTREIGLAVLATTLSLIAVFLPVAFMTGIVGRFMNSFGLTMAFAIFISLIVSFTLTPMLASRWLKPAKKAAASPSTETPDGLPLGFEENNDATSEAIASKPSANDGHGGHGGSKQGGFFKPIDAVYTFLLKWSMKHRWAIVLITIAVLLSSVPLGMRVNKNFLPEDDESQFQVTVRAPEGTSLAATETLGNRIAAEIRKLKGVEYTVLAIGDNQQRSPNVANIFVKMPPDAKRPGWSQQDAMQLARAEVLPKFRGLRASVTPVPAFSGGGGPPSGASYTIGGRDLKKLEEYSNRVVAAVKKSPGAVDVDTSLIAGKPEIGVRIDRKRAAELGVNVADIANALRYAVGGAGGTKVTDYSELGEQYEVRLRSNLNYRNDPRSLNQITVPSAVQQGGVTLDQVVYFETGTGLAQISRLNRQRQVTISAGVLPGFSQQAVQEAMGKAIKDLNVPPDYTADVAGNSREQVKAFGAFAQAFLLSLIFMYLILAAQFESWVHPITILISLPLTVPFALVSILITGVSLNIWSMLGILVLFGVVKKNSILQVDHTNQLRARGMNRYDAIIQANRDRLRPILMTTVAFVVGMFPLVLSSGTGAVSNRNIGYTVIGGQSLALLLTLLATPVFYSLFDDVVTTPLWGKLRNGISRFAGRFRRA